MEYEYIENPEFKWYSVNEMVLPESIKTVFVRLREWKPSHGQYSFIGYLDIDCTDEISKIYYPQLWRNCETGNDECGWYVGKHYQLIEGSQWCPIKIPD